MDDHHITSLLGQSPDAHWNDSRSGLTVIAESSSGPSVALPEINVFGGDVAASAPSRKSTQRSDPQDLEAKLADESITHEQHKPISRTDTAGAQSWKSKITQNFHHLSRTASNESNFAPRTPVRNSTIQTNASASFDDTAPWDKKAILSLDGGGIRGYSALLMIRALMEAIGELERNYRATSATSAGPAASSYHPILPNVSATTDAAPMNSQAMDDPPATATSPWLPCHYFDYMAGTSTGGLISIMLGRLRMNVDDCIRDYETFGARVFGRSRWFSIRMSPFLWIRDKYDNKILEEVVKSVVRERGPKIAGFPGGQNFAFDENRCRVVVVAYQQTESDDAGKPYLFRTYKNLHRSKDNETRKALDLNPGLAHDIPIWQVARATSAAPTYFKAAKIDGLEYLDGGFGGTNNPSKEICDEVLTMNNRAKGCLNVVVSIGTGKNKKLSRWRSKKSWMPAGRYINFMNFAKKWASQSETQHNDMIRDQRNYEFEYFRLNVETGLDEMKLDEWRARGKIRTEAGRCVGKLRAKLRTHMHKASSTATAGSYGTEKPSNTSEEDESTVSSNKTLASSDDLVPHCLRPRNKTIEYITEHTNKYLQQPEVQEWVRECAVILVEGRRRRALSDPGRWEKTCFDTWYQCTVPKCPRGEKKYESINGIRQHLLDKHRDRFRPEPENSLDEKALKKALVECKIIVH